MLFVHLWDSVRVTKTFRSCGLAWLEMDRKFCPTATTAIQNMFVNGSEIIKYYNFCIDLNFRIKHFKFNTMLFLIVGTFILTNKEHYSLWQTYSMNYHYVPIFSTSNMGSTSLDSVSTSLDTISVRVDCSCPLRLTCAVCQVSVIYIHSEYIVANNITYSEYVISFIHSVTALHCNNSL